MGNAMKRRIVQHGSSSLTITLPIKWVEKYGLKKGDELAVEEAGGQLLLSTGKEITSPSKQVSVTEAGLFTKNNLSHLYQLGYDEIEIRFADAKTLEEIKQRLPDCIGFEIIDQSEKRIVIKSIATTLESEFDTLLRKSFQVTNEMAKSMIEALEKRQYSRLAEIRTMEALNNRFTDVCIRILNKKGYAAAPKRTMQMYEVVKNIERIADEFKYSCDLFSVLAENVRVEKVSRGKAGVATHLDPKIVSLFKEAVDYYFTFYALFYKFDPELKKKIYSGRKALRQKGQQLLENSKGINALFLHHILGIVERTYEGAGGYFALVL